MFFWSVKNKNTSGGSGESHGCIENESKSGIGWRKCFRSKAQEMSKIVGENNCTKNM